MALAHLISWGEQIKTKNFEEKLCKISNKLKIEFAINKFGKRQ